MPTEPVRCSALSFPRLTETLSILGYLLRSLRLLGLALAHDPDCATGSQKYEICRRQNGGGVRKEERQTWYEFAQLASTESPTLRISKLSDCAMLV
ncbi:hypothetical protein N7539_004841 [Penicillium diatomitis]|uniref:Uncharacterized protein n=1 Tax=Penicillium diatomitis TaxID=2819901 RepID=A0A9W9X5S7_9EURO|nr:uncharacterized protein N7539_004841 [Penicillium diatomitis]KAJ5484853.1 hypothetical protein N7539_004841 [Penicillium diatomitis]